MTAAIFLMALNVFSFNLCAETVYILAGFCSEGVLQDAVRDGDLNGEDILMEGLENE